MRVSRQLDPRLSNVQGAPDIPKEQEHRVDCSGKMLKPSRASVEAMAEKIPHGMVMTTLQLRKVLAEKRKRPFMVIPGRLLYHAATLFYGYCASGPPGEKMPAFEPDSLLEVRPIFRIRHKDAMAWANREAEKQFRKK
jgi:hypothetical protein